MSAQWWQWLVWSPNAMRVVRNADALLETDHIQWVTWPEDRKYRTAVLFVELLCKTIPSYRLDFQFYTQFVAFAVQHTKSDLTELAKHLDGIAKAARGRDEPLRMAADGLKSYVAMFALNTKSAAVGRLRRKSYADRTRSTNDIVQYYLAVKLNDMIERFQPT